MTRCSTNDSDFVKIHSLVSIFMKVLQAYLVFLNNQASKVLEPMLSKG